MPPRGRSTGGSGRPSGQQQHHQQRLSPSERRAEAAWQCIERLWLPMAAACTTTGTCSILPQDQLHELSSSLAAAAQRPPSGHEACPQAVFTAVAQLLALSLSDLAQELSQPGGNASLYYLLARVSLVILTGTVDSSLTLQGPRSSLVVSDTRRNELLAVLLSRMRVPELLATMLARSHLSHTAAAQDTAAHSSTPSSSSSSSTAGTTPHTASAPAQRQQHSGRSQAMGSVLGASAGFTLEHALSLCTTCVVSVTLLTVTSSSPLAPARHALRALARSQLLDQTARAMLAAAAGAGVCQEASGTARVLTLLDGGMYNLNLNIDAAPLPTNENAAAAGIPFLAALRCMGLTRWDQPTVRRALAAPGLQYWVAARMVQALRAVDGGPSWGMPEVALPLPEPQHWTSARGPASACALTYISVAAPVLIAGLCQRMQQRQHQHQQQGSVPGSASCNGGGGDAVSAARGRAPVQPGGMYRIAVRLLDWAVSAPPATAAQPRFPLPRRMRASPIAKRAAHRALPLALLASLAGSRKAAARRKDALLPHAVAVLAGACDANGRQRNDEVVTNAEAAFMALAALENLVASARIHGSMAAAGACGVLPALQAAVAWLTPEREEQQPPTQRATLRRRLHRCINHCLAYWCGPGAEAPAAPLRTQLAALVVSLRSSFIGFWRVYGPTGRPAQDAVEVCEQWAGSLATMTNTLLNWSAAETARSATLLAPKLGTFLLVQCAPRVGRMAAWEIMACVNGSDVAKLWIPVLQVIAVAARACRLRALLAESLVAPAAAVAPAGAGLEQQQQVGGSSAGSSSSSSPVVPKAGAQAAKEAAAAASWRCFLLRDLCALDMLGLMLKVASQREEPTQQQVELLLDTLHGICHALPRDVQRHLALGRAQPTLSALPAARHFMERGMLGCSDATHAAGCGLAWLQLDARTRALLGPRRLNRPALLAFLEGASAQVPELGPLRAKQHEASAHAFEAPCEAAALLPTCDNPMCAEQACYLTAGCGGPLPPLRPCPKCGLARYCSTGCRKAHWDAYHKAECGRGWWVSGSCS